MHSSKTDITLGNFANDLWKMDPTEGSGLTKQVMSFFDDGLDLEIHQMDKNVIIVNHLVVA
jgi:hypothetical protein